MDSYLRTGNDESEKCESVSSASKPTFDFTERTWKEDFTLIVEDKKLYVTKALLALVSPVFEKMFQSDFKEKDQTEMELPGKKFDDMQDFLRCIYPSITSGISEQNVYKVLPLADEYQVSCLKTKCEIFLINRLEELSTDELYDMLQHATTYNLDGLLEKCITKISYGTVADLDIAIERSSVPLKTICAIQDKMVRRLEETEKEKRWFEAAYKFLLSGLKAAETREIEACAGWTGASLELSLVVKELKYQDIWQSREFRLLGMDAKCSVKRYNSYSNLQLQLSIDENKIDGFTISIVGRFVIKNGTTKNENFTNTFKMTFKDGSSTQLHYMFNNDILFNVAEGYIYQGKFEAEIHLLAEMHKSQ
ncbi:uncharacterized protein LOC128546303 [Mercenaria mercenaria]|uniref:uncharacterized protein LOC128546303 n=1 Tax=Mercenaria mercenaria TaxID=6596 RepID=UPI00234E7996|nr:uncharacterized protein LOC128546303 [Mercenaria mercenaria]